METITLSPAMMWVCGLLAVVFIIFAISTLILSIKYNSLKKGNANLWKMREESVKTQQTFYESLKKSDAAFNLLVAACDEEFLQKYLSEVQPLLFEAIVRGENYEDKLLLCKKIRCYFQEKKDKEIK